MQKKQIGKKAQSAKHDYNIYVSTLCKSEVNSNNPNISDILNQIPYCFLLILII